MGEVMDTRERFTAAAQPRIRQVTLKSIGADVWIKSLNGVERARIGDAWSALGEKPSFEDSSRGVGFLTIALGLVDGSGNRIFGDCDLDLIGELDAAVLDELSDAIQALNGLRKDGVEEAVKNSGAGPSGDSVSD